MYFNFETILTLATVLTGLIWLIDSLFFAWRRLNREGIVSPGTKLGFMTKMHAIFIGPKQTVKMNWVTEYSRSFFPILLVVLLLRSFVYEPFRIPSGSDEPTLLIGDLILVNKHIYGLRVPVINKKIRQGQEPKTGDIIIFRYPVDPGMDLIKRVIGMPGDHVSYINKVVYVNGMKASQKLVGKAVDIDAGGNKWPVEIKSENLFGTEHLIYQRTQVSASNFDIVVPPNKYFVMGDNRDDSLDSRYWGFVPEENLVGKATLIWFSWRGFSDGLSHVVRWDRIGKRIQ